MRLRPLRVLCGTAALALTLPVLSPGPAAAAVPASSAYLYYNDSDKSWAAPLAIKIAP